MWNKLPSRFNSVTLNGYIDYLAENIQNYVFAQTAPTWSRPATMWCGLSTRTDPPPEMAGTADFPEPNTGPPENYSRVQVGPAQAIWGDAIPVSSPTDPKKWQTVNSGDIVFPTAGALWGDIASAAIFEDSVAVAQSGLVGGVLQAPKTITTGTSPLFLSGSFTITTSNS